MDNKEFSKELEKRTRKFAVKIIKISAQLPNTPEGRVVERKLQKQDHQLVPITEKRIEQEVKPILEIKLESVKARPMRLNFG